MLTKRCVVKKLQFIFFLAIIVVIFKYWRDTERYDVKFGSNDCLGCDFKDFFIFQNDELTYLIRHLNSQNAFIIDIDFLKNLKKFEKYLKFNIDYFQKILNNKKKLQISFGIKSEFVDILSLKV